MRESPLLSLYTQRYCPGYPLMSTMQWIPKNGYKRMPNITLSAKGIEKLLVNLNPHQASCPQKSIEEGDIPNQWKSANVAPIYKKGDRSNPANYRPISLICVISLIWAFFTISNMVSVKKNPV